MKLLAFETATEGCSVALNIDGEVIERFEIAPRLHAEYALPWAEQLLAEAGIKRSQLDAIAISRGPGAFTGVRLAIALAQGIALALDKPVVAVSTLQVIAARARLPGFPLSGEGSGEGRTRHRILAAIDARMGEIYVGAFERIHDEPIAVSTETVIPPHAYTLPDDGDTQAAWHGVGTGFSAGNDALSLHLGSRLLSVDATALPHAADVARLAAIAFERGEALPPDRVQPAYLRNNVALTLEEQKVLRASR